MSIHICMSTFNFRDQFPKARKRILDVRQELDLEQIPEEDEGENSWYTHFDKFFLTLFENPIFIMHSSV